MEQPGWLDLHEGLQAVEGSVLNSKQPHLRQRYHLNRFFESLLSTPDTDGDTPIFVTTNTKILIFLCFKKLQLTDSQISQLDQTFYDHKLKLVDYGAEMEKEDLKLQNLLDSDVPSEGQVGSQVDQVLAARGKLEREYTMMNLDLRKILSVEQWRQLKSIREERGFGDHLYFFKKLPPGGTPAGPGAELMPPPPLPPLAEEMF